MTTAVSKDRSMTKLVAEDLDAMLREEMALALAGRMRREGSFWEGVKDLVGLGETGGAAVGLSTDRLSELGLARA